MDLPQNALRRISDRAPSRFSSPHRFYGTANQVSVGDMYQLMSTILKSGNGVHIVHGIRVATLWEGRAVQATVDFRMYLLRVHVCMYLLVGIVRRVRGLHTDDDGDLDTALP
ncbi:predicted protein [Coccidioides posadasii str. Silveira]|uniref:Predicted protein n=1 Tax=Coccidioides posadasii (strain RMSCC 757 / Silveira) TaxID=443226 RepID=E9DCU6_COCPS|nr:predicted protein [Coccidioides posadasii str. Silveira]